MGDGTEENPFTREDVETKIKEHDGPKGLDLSGKVFEKGMNLRGINRDQLPGIILKEAVLEECHLEGLQLSHAHFEGAFMSGAHLEDIRASGVHFENTELDGVHLERARLMAAHLEGAEFFDAHLEEATLVNAFLDRARLSGAHLQGAYLFGAKFTANTKIESVDWGNYVLGEEKDGNDKRQRDFFKRAEDTYRRLKQWCTNAGVYDIAGEFFFREMEAKRKSIKWWPKPQHRGWVEFVSFICGYGERPLRVIGWAASVVLISALIYFIAGSVWAWSAFWNSLYFSAVSFTALGYGSWLQATNDWIKGIGAFESFVGVFTIALFLITFTRKMRR